MDEITAAYIAGILDGEGCFRIDRFKTDRSPLGYQYRSIVEVTMCEQDSIEFIAQATGKNIYQKTLPSGRISHTIVWRNRIAANLIRDILPYLRGKKPQAEICLHFEDNVTPGRGRRHNAYYHDHAEEFFFSCESS